MTRDAPGPGGEGDTPPPDPLQDDGGQHSPFDWYGRMRDDGPVQYDTRRGVYDVFGYREVKRGLGTEDGLVRPTLSSGEPAGSPLSYIDNAVVWTDGPEHTRTKGELFPFFTPDRIGALRGRIGDIAADQVQRATDAGREFDFVEEFGAPLPLRVIMDVVGVPARDHEQVLRWLVYFRNQKHSESGQFGDGEPARLRGAVEYFRELVDRRRRDPQGDLLSELVAETDLDGETIGANCFNLILAGQGTLTNLLSNALYLFAEHGMVGELDRYDMELVLEEVLRYRAPLQSRARMTTRPIRLGATEIPAGETVILWIGAANRDPTAFDRPDVFRPDRDPDHLSFGRGPHTCIGAPLARLEAPIALETFFDHVGRVDVRESYQPKSAPSELGFERLPIETES